MARITSFAGSTLTVTLTESLTIDQRDYGSKQTISIPSIVDVTRRLVTVTTTEATVLNFGAAIGAGTYIVGDVMYMRFTNLDDTNHVILTFANEDDDEFAIKVDKGHSFIIIGDVAGGMADMIDAKDSALTYSIGDLKSVTVDADDDDVDMEIYIASK
jgi:hypothetical protein|tara:strand:+ start:396 stop:869 length:474 start_codon:yes stop_codon:yes gene_type:complete